MRNDMCLLEVEGLTIRHRGPVGVKTLVHEVSFELDQEQANSLVLVGESGSGKTLTCLALTRLLDPNDGFEVSGSIRYAGRCVLSMGPRQLQALRGQVIAYVFQEPMTALNPHYSIGFQILESLKVRGVKGKAARQEACELLECVGLGVSQPERFLKRYPHELSGGMRQRSLIAMALACRPQILVADEPTTALDTLLQKQIVDLILDLQQRFGMALLFITHNLGLAKAVARDTLVLHQGHCVEHGPTKTLLKSPRHPYTQNLLRCVPRLVRPAAV